MYETSAALDVIPPKSTYLKLVQFANIWFKFVTAEDVKEWFALHGEESTSKINTISLISAVPYLDSADNLWYKDYRPVTKYNMTNKPLSDPNSGLEITYILYY